MIQRNFKYKINNCSKDIRKSINFLNTFDLNKKITPPNIFDKFLKNVNIENYQIISKNDLILFDHEKLKLIMETNKNDLLFSNIFFEKKIIENEYNEISITLKTLNISFNEKIINSSENKVFFDVKIPFIYCTFFYIMCQEEIQRILSFSLSINKNKVEFDSEMFITHLNFIKFSSNSISNRAIKFDWLTEKKIYEVKIEYILCIN